MSEYTEHARLSPSGSQKWLTCAGSIALEAHVPNESSSAADDGTACHTVAAWCLTEHWRATKYIGREIQVNAAHEPKRTVEFTDEMAEWVQQYVDEVRFEGIGNEMWIEQRVEFSSFIDVPEQFGTSDCSIYVAEHRELQVRDAKFGYHPVEAENNPQLMIYALGMLAKLELSHEIDRVRLCIHQPRLRKGALEWVISVEDLLRWANEVAKPRAQRTIVAEKELARCADDQDFQDWSLIYLNQNPNEKDCAFCRAQSTCPSARRFLEETVGAKFEVIAERPSDEESMKQWIPEPGPRLDRLMAATDFLEDFIRSVRATMEKHLLAGGESEMFGLELGRQGARRWKDQQEAERMLREQFRLPMDVVYNMKVISPTQAEKLAPKKPKKRRKKGEAVVEEAPLIGPRQWIELCELVERAPAKPSVKLKSTIKIPYDPTAQLPNEDDFDAQPESEDDDIA